MADLWSTVAEEDSSDEESVDEGAENDTSRHFVQGTLPPVFISAGQVIHEQGMRQKEQISHIATRIVDLVQANNFESSTCSTYNKVWLSAMEDPVRLFYDIFKSEYRKVSGGPLHEGIVLQFFLILKIMNMYSISATEYFRYAKGPAAPYLRLHDNLPEETFMTIWRIIDSDPQPKPAGTETRCFPKRYVGNDQFRRFMTGVTDPMLRLVEGCPQMDVAVDDLMIVACNKMAMAEAGLPTSYNNRKADKNGISFDVITASPRLNIVIGFAVGFNDDEPKHKHKATIDTLAKLNQRTAVHVTADRGYDALVMDLINLGIQATSTSRKGGRKSSIPFSDGFAETVQPDGRMTLPKVAKHNTTMAHWIISEGTSVPPVLHGAFEVRSNKPAVLLKTTDMQAENKYLVLPASGKDRAELARLYGASLQTSTPVSSSTVSTTTFTPPPPTDSQQLPSPATAADTFLNSYVARLCQLSVAQRTQFWFLVRRAISSTIAIKIIPWLLKTRRRSIFITGQSGSLEDLAIQIVPNELVPEQSPVVPGYSTKFDQHMDFVTVLTGKKPQLIPKHLSPLVGGGLEAASKECIIDAAIGQGIYKLDGRKKTNTLSDEALESLKSKLAASIDKEFLAIDYDLSRIILKSFEGTFKGNSDTSKGHQSEKAFVPIMHEKLQGVKFGSKKFVHTTDGDVASTELNTVASFAVIYPARSYGCLSQTPDSRCVASVDGLFCAKYSEDGELEPWVLEVKTKTSAKTIKEARSGGSDRMFEIDEHTCSLEMKDLAESLSDADFSLQVLHHAAATGIRNALLAILDYESGTVIRFVAIRFSASLLERHRSTIDFIANRFMPFLWRDTMLTWGGIDGKRLNFLRRFRDGAIGAQTLRDERQAIATLTYKYNCTKSGVDILHKIMGTIPSPDLGTARRLYLAGIDVAMINADQCARAYMVREQLGPLCSAEELSRVVNGVGTQRELTIELVSSFHLSDFPKYDPPKQLRQEIVQIDLVVTKHDPNYRPQDPKWVDKVLSKRDEASALGMPEAVSSSAKRFRTSSSGPTGMSPIAEYFFTDADLCSLRLGGDGDKMFAHEIVTSFDSSPDDNSLRRCVLCCSSCEKGETDDHGRLAFQTKKRCSMCQVFLCTIKRKIWGNVSCFDRWHGDRNIPGPHPFALSMALTAVASAGLVIGDASSSVHISVQPHSGSSSAPMPRVNLIPREVARRKNHATPPALIKPRRKSSKEKLALETDSAAVAEALTSLSNSSAAAATALASLNVAPLLQQPARNLIEPRRLDFHKKNKGRGPDKVVRKKS